MCFREENLIQELSPGSYIVTEEFLVSKLTVWSIIQKYKVHGTISCLSGSGRPFKQMREQLQELVQTTK